MSVYYDIQAFDYDTYQGELTKIMRGSENFYTDLSEWEPISVTWDNIGQYNEKKMVWCRRQIVVDEPIDLDQEKYGNVYAITG